MIPSVRPALSQGRHVPLATGEAPTLADALILAAERHPGNGLRIIGEAATTRRTYPELLEAARRTLTALRAAGLGPGDRLICVVPPAADFFPVFWGCLLGGIVPTVVARPILWEEGDPGFEKLVHTSAKLGGPPVVGAEGTPLHRLRPDWELLDTAALLAGEPAMELHRPRPSDVALYQLSSGSTAKAKVIPLTHKGLVQLAVGVREDLGVDSESALLNWMPLDHSGGLLLYPVAGLWNGADVTHVHTELVIGSPARWLDLLDEYAVTHSWAPNFAYRQVTEAVAALGEPRWRLDRLRSLVSGGEQVSPATMRDFFAATAPSGLREDAFTTAWGMAETTTAISFAAVRPDRIHRVRRESLGGRLERVNEDGPDVATLLSVGPPSPGASFRIVGPDGTVLSEDHVGRLQLRSERITTGYLDDPAADAEVFSEDGWFDTGDLAFMANGEITIAGRAKDLLILNGNNHYCHDIEQAATVPGVLAGHVVACGIPNDGTGTEDLVVFCTPEPGYDPADVAARVRATVGERLRLLVARVVAVAEAEFPRTSSGKLQRLKLRERFVAGGFDEPGVPVAEAVSAVLSEFVPPPFERGRPFHELGLGSLQLARVRVRLTEVLGREVPITALYAHPTAEALASHLAGGPVPKAIVEPEPVGAPDSRIAVIGMAARFPGARDVGEFWANLLAGVDSVITYADGELAANGVPRGPGRVGATGALDGVEAFDHRFFGMSAKEAALTDPQQRLFAECAHHALEHAGYAGGERRIGLFAGSGMNLYPHHTYLRNNLSGAVDEADPLDAVAIAVGNQPDFLATRAAYRLGLTGPAVNVQTACSTSLVAVHMAVRSLLSGESEIAVAGASAVHVPQLTAYRHAEGSILSAAGRCRPFDADADGTVGGNGVAAVVLKPYAKALADGDTIHGIIVGTAVNNDGAGKVGFTAPSESGQVEVMRAALSAAGIEATGVGYVEAHGTGTLVGDPIEVGALAKVYGAGTVLGSVKANIGHLDSCSGMAGLIKALLVVRDGEIPPQINYRRPNPALGLEPAGFRIPTAPEPWRGTGPRRAAVTALGVGGTNAHVIVEEPGALPPGAAEAGPVVLPLSAADAESLADLAVSTRDFLRAGPGAVLGDVAATAALGRRHLRHRLAVTGSDAAGLAAELDRHLAGRSGPRLAAGHEQAGALVFTFTGQGADPEPVDALSERFPAFAEVFDRAAEAARSAGADIRAAMVDPNTEWTTELAQPAIVAVQCAMTALWTAAGLRPGHVCGHSVGEFAALVAAGALTVEDAVRLAAGRGRLMRRSGAEGAMLAVLAERAVVDSLLESLPGLELAVVNGAEQFTLGGPSKAVDDAEKLCAGLDVSYRRLAVTRAFHTRLVEPVLGDLAELAASVVFKPVAVPFVSSVDGKVRAPGWAPDAAYVRAQARATVRFDAALDTLAGTDRACFLEVGSDAVLTGIGRRHDASARWIATQRRGVEQVDAVMRAAAGLYAAGADLDWTALQRGRRVPLPAYPFRPHRHWVEPAAKEAEHAVAVPVATAPGPVLDRIVEVTAELLGAEPGGVAAGDDFVELGADSLSLINLTRRVGDEYGVRIPMRELFGELNTPGKLAGAVASRMEPVGVPPVSASVAVAEPVVSGVPAPVAGPAGDGVEGIIHRQLALMEEQLRLLGGPVRPESVVAPVIETVPEPTAVPVTRAAPATGEALIDFGLYFFGDYPEGRAGAYRHILDAARFADTEGFHSVWMPERHFHSFGGIFPNPSVLASAIAAQTTRIRLNAGSVVLPLHNPIRVAEEWSMVDNLSGGRVGIGVAPGWSAQDFVLAPENFGRHKAVMYENLATVRELWAGGSVTGRSGTGEDIEVRLFPRPVQERPPMFTAIVGNPDSYRQAAAADLGVITNLMTQDVDALAANIALYRATRAENGLDPDAGRVVVLLHTHLGPDDAEARRAAFEPFCAYLKSSLSLLGQVANSLGMSIDFENTPADDLRFMLERAYERYCAERALIGSPERAEAIVRAVKDAGADEIAAFIDFGLTAAEVAAGLPHLDALRRSFLVEAQAATEVAPMSPGQRRLWTVDRISPGGTGYNEAAAVRLDGPLDAGALRNALQRFTDRHATLRTVYGEADGEPRQFVRPRTTVDLTVTEHAADTEAGAVEGVMSAESRRVFDLAEGPVSAFRLLRFGPERHVFVCVFHHITADGWSYGIFARELGELYRAEVTGSAAALPTPDTTYADLARERDGEPTAPGALAYWRERLGDAPPPLDLPTGRARPESPSDSGRSLFLDLSSAATERVIAYGRRNRVTLFTVLITGLAAALRQRTGREDFVLGTGVAGRDERSEAVFGFMVETVPLRLDLRGATSFRDLTARVADLTAEAVDHAVPFDEIVRAVNPPRRPGRGALFDIAVEYSNSATFGFDFPGVTATRLPVGLSKAPADLTVYVSCDETVRWHVEYRTDVYDEETVRGLFAAFEETLAAGVEDPDGDLGRRSDAELVPVLEGPPAIVDGATLHGLVARSIAEHGDRIAVADDEVRWTYRELGERADAIASMLHAEGVGAGDIVAVCLERSPVLVAAQLAVMRRGAAFLPLDPQSPPERLRMLVAACGARGVIGADLGAAFALDVEGPLPQAPVEAVEVDAEAAAYCIFTSGSSGRPKAVLVPHRAVANTVRWRAATTELSVTDVVGHHLGLGFDANLAEIYPTLVSGATLRQAPDHLRTDPRGLARWWRAEGVTVATLPTALMEELFTEELPQGHRVRCLVTGGSRLLRRPPASSPTVVNEYGPTENAIVTTAGVVSPHGSKAPDIGRPIDGNRLYVVDRAGRSVPRGAEGELWVAGTGVALGYLGDEEATAVSFTPDPAGDGLVYRTGDLVAVTPDGAVDFRGRVDGQVSIRGNRVEPGEVEAALAAVDGVRQVAVVDVEERGETRLAAYVVGERGLTAEALAETLAERLPSYLVPELWSFPEEIALSANGKVDRDRLPAPTAAAVVARPASRPASKLEEAIGEIWCAELGLPEIPVDVSFFDLGGHSLGAIRTANRIQDELGIEVPVVKIFDTPTVRGLAAALGGGVEEADEVEDSAPLSFQQEQMWAAMALRDNPASTQIALRVDIEGPLDTVALETAIDGVIAGHGALRTRIVERDGVGRQEVLRHRRFSLPIEEVPPDSVDAWCVRWGREPHDLLSPPLLRARLAKTAENKRVLLLAAQHLVIDGWSVLNVAREIGERYRAAIEGRTEDEREPMATYAAYARDQRAGEALAAPLLDYWRRELAGAPARLLHPTDHPRSALVSTAGDEYTFAFPTEVVDRIGELASALRTTTHPVLSAGFALLTAALTGERDIVLAGPYAHRERREHEALVGFFASLMPTRVDVSAVDSFGELVTAVHRSFLSGLGHQPVPFPQILGALDANWTFGAPAPVATALLTVNPPVPALELPGLRTQVIDLALETARRDFVFLVAPEAGRIGGAVEFSTDLYDRDTMVRWCDAFVRVVDRGSSDPATSVSTLLGELEDLLRPSG
ncbi:MupA/Atu3671 family FMN-dependent luciferase-like monooxygenase [Phytomonospora sp. NPDC050363]|uniref:non-ribosomal peptide synthetase/type I polyketide synthase n=1 Tax=Phytomonospora sp. NPDC050363 TaxID=3155642 RepID=UPI003407295E